MELKVNRDVSTDIRLVDYSKFSFHWHDSIEILYVIDGKVKLTDWSGTYILEEGDFFIVGLNNTHLVEGCSDTTTVLEIHVEGKLCKEKISELADKVIHCNSAGKIKYELKDKIEYIGNEIKRISRVKDEVGNYETEINVIELLKYIYDRFDYVTFGESKKKLEKKRESRCKDIYIKYFIEKKTDITLKEIASEMKVNYHHLSKDISNIYGRNFKKLKFDFLLERAMKKVVSSNDNITEISYGCGFSDPKYFIKYFREKYHCTPTEFRNRYYENSVKFL